MNRTAEIQINKMGQCRLPADFDLVQPAIKELRCFLEQLGANAEALSAIELAAVEALNNAIKHGAAGRENARVTLWWSCQGDDLTVRISDPGHFNPGPAWIELPEDPLSESGRGGFLIKNLVDSVEHTNDSEGHTIHLKKNLAPLMPPPSAAETEEVLAAMTEDLSASYENLAALFSISELLATTLDFGSFLNQVLARLRSLVSAQIAYVCLTDADGNRYVGKDELPNPENHPILGKIAQHEQVALVEQRELAIGNRSEKSPGEHAPSDQGGAFIRPLLFSNTPLGILAVGRTEDSFFTAGELNLIRTVGDYLAITCATSNMQREKEAQARVAREFQIAANIQASLLPRTMPVLPAWEVNGVCISATEIGGDFFDIIHQADGGLVVVIADVMGKGLPAALLASILRAAVRARVDTTPDPARLMTAINRQLYEDLSALDMFITVQLAFFSPDGKDVRISSAGHGDVMKVSPRTSEWLKISGPGEIPLGILPDIEYSDLSLRLSSGEAFVFITDGLYEIEDESGAQLGCDGLAIKAAQIWQGEPKQFIDALLLSLEEFQHSKLQSDDRTIVAVKHC